MLRSRDSSRLPFLGKGFPLPGPDSLFDLSGRTSAGSEADAELTDLPLRDDSGPVDSQGSLRASKPDLIPARDLTLGQQPQPSSSRGVVVWFIAAASLVAGVVIGFTSGYAAGQRNLREAAIQNIADNRDPVSVDETPSKSASPTDASAQVGQPFSEQSVAEPTRVDPEEVVVPEESPARPSPSTRSLEASGSNELGPGSLSIMSRPAGAEVILDGRMVGRTPLVISSVAPGTHSVRLELPGFNRWTTSVDVKAGTRTRVAASLEQP